jgi:hypothetical protein
MTRSGRETAAGHRVLLLRPWVDAHAGQGCCSGDTRDAIGLDSRPGGPVEHPYAARVVGQSYRRLRESLPDVDVQVVSAGNTVYLLPAVLRGLRLRDGAGAVLRRLNEATRPGSVIVDGAYAGDVVDLGPEGVVRVVRERLGA